MSINTSTVDQNENKKQDRVIPASPVAKRSGEYIWQPLTFLRVRSWRTRFRHLALADEDLLN